MPAPSRAHGEPGCQVPLPLLVDDEVLDDEVLDDEVLDELLLDGGLMGGALPAPPAPLLVEALPVVAPVPPVPGGWLPSITVGPQPAARAAVRRMDARVGVRVEMGCATGTSLDA